MLLNAIAPIESSPLRLAEVPAHEPAAGEVRLKVHCCAICRTDLHVIEGDLPAAKLPVIPGHQVVGTIDQVGSDVEHLRVGDRVGIAWLRHTCGQCRFCTSGRENLCEFSQYTGYHADGGYAEYAVVPAEFAYPIPPVFNDIDAAPLLCAGIIGYRALNRSNLQCDGRLAIFGFGSSAHIVLQLALARECEVYVISRSPNHQQMARDLGATWVGDDVASMPHKATAAIVFAPSGKVVPAALDAVDRGSAVALAGIHMSPIPELDYDRQLFNERDLHPVTANTRDDARALLIEAAKIPVKPLTRLYHLEDANVALQDMKAGTIDGTGVLQITEHGRPARV
jgi:propanol-preferring alcohol dehydrogenase